MYGRAVSLAFAGSRKGRASSNGTAFVNVIEMKNSVNYQLLAEGLVYPTFYSKLYVDFREVLTAAAVEAREGGVGLWADDSTLEGFTLTTADQLTDSLVILPKLFRRLAEYLTDTSGSVALSGFETFLSSHADDKLYTVPAGQATNLDTLVEIKGRKLKLTTPPEQIVFLES